MTRTTEAKKFTWTISIALGALLMIGLPAQARFDYTNWQPQLGPVNSVTDSLEARMNADYDRGLIDSSELSMLRRDLDGICAQEDEFRMDHNGLGAHDIKCMQAKLRRFTQNLSRAEGDKVVVIANQG